MTVEYNVASDCSTQCEVLVVYVFKKWANDEIPILYFPIPHNALCLPPQILHKLLLRNALGNMQTSQENFRTIVYAKFGGQTESVMDNWKIVNGRNKEIL